MMRIPNDRKNEITSMLSNRVRKRMEYELARKTFIGRGEFHFYPEEGRVITSLKQLLEIYNEEPMMQRGINKKAKDLVEAGFEITGRNKRYANKINDEFQDFVKEKNILYRLWRTCADAMIYGNGFLEMVYEDDTYDAELPPEGEWAEIKQVSPRTIIIVEERHKNNERYGEIVKYLSVPPTWGLGMNTSLAYPYLVIGNNMTIPFRNATPVHPDRIIHLKFNAQSDSHCGRSLIEPLYSVLSSKIDADKSFGTILKRHAKPFLDVTIVDGKPAEIEVAGQWCQQINSRPDKVSHLVHDDKWQSKVLGAEGKVLRPKEYMDYLTEQISICIGIPKTLLVGSEQGTISGSELNLVAYFQQIESEQQTILTPIIKRMMRAYFPEEYDLSGLGVEWKHPYADEMGMVKSAFMDSQGMVKAYESGLLPKNEVRRRMCKIYGLEYSEDDKEYKKGGTSESGGMFPQNKPQKREDRGIPNPAKEEPQEPEEK
ncbi:MAG: anti-CBASS protein Acb1 family protein [Candidatus Thorarchaeota archaeon]